MSQLLCIRDAHLRTFTGRVEQVRGDPTRVVDVVGLDEQADGGLHVRPTDEVGRIRVVQTENKGKGCKRVRLEVLDG